MRERAGLSVTQLAAKIGVSERMVRAYEEGAARPGLDRMPLIAELFGVTLSEMYEALPPRRQKV
ncbi:MAG: helix-turn-helix domain-containing protein [Actinomycetes bacterium]